MERLNKQPLFTNRIHCNSSPYPSSPFVTLQKYGSNTQNISPDVPEHSPEFPDPCSKSETKPLQLFRHLCWPDPVPNDSSRNSETHCAASRDASGATSGPRRLRVTRRDQARRWFDDALQSRGSSRRLLRVPKSWLPGGLLRLPLHPGSSPRAS